MVSQQPTPNLSQVPRPLSGVSLMVPQAKKTLATYVIISRNTGI